jgi:hypothetical protein
MSPRSVPDLMAILLLSRYYGQYFVKSVVSSHIIQISQWDFMALALPVCLSCYCARIQFFNCPLHTTQHQWGKALVTWLTVGILRLQPLGFQHNHIQDDNGRLQWKTCHSISRRFKHTKQHNTFSRPKVSQFVFRNLNTLPSPTCTECFKAYINLFRGYVQCF